MLQWTKNLTVLGDLHIISLVSLVKKKCSLAVCDISPQQPSDCTWMRCIQASHLGCEQPQHVLLVLPHAKSPRERFPRPFPRKPRSIRRTDSTLLGTRHCRFIVRWLTLAHAPAESHHPTDIWHTGHTDRDVLGPEHPTG